MWQNMIKMLHFSAPVRFVNIALVLCWKYELVALTCIVRAQYKMCKMKGREKCRKRVKGEGRNTGNRGGGEGEQEIKAR